MKQCKEIGVERLDSPIVSGVSTENSPLLKGVKALISRASSGGWYVQVTDLNSEFAFGWWWFPAKDWVECT